MIELEAGKMLEVNIREDARGRDRVVVALHAYGCAIDLTPHQARVLATELIMAVNRAEVRSNPKPGPHMVRGAQPGLPKQGPFNREVTK